MKIVPLSKENLEKAIKLVENIFDSKPDEWDSPRKWMPASLNPNSNENKKLYSENKINFLKYFVGIEDEKIIATTGIYLMEEDKLDSAWLAWFCVDKSYRGNGYGEMLIDFIISMAKKMNKKYLKLYTSKNPDLYNALKLYDKKGFKEIRKDIHPDTGEELIYLSLEF